jgi:hypothetical protein
MISSLRSLTAALAIAGATLTAPGLASVVAAAPASATTFGAVHCHTAIGCTEGELHHGEHRAEDHLRHEEHRVERGHLF